MSNETIEQRLPVWALAVIGYLAVMGLLWHVIVIFLVAIQYFFGVHLPCRP